MGRSRKGATPPFVLQLRATVAANLLAAVRQRAKAGEKESDGFERLAKESGVGTETIRRACRDFSKEGTPDLNLFNLAKLAHALRVPPAALLTPYAMEQSAARDRQESDPPASLQRNRN